MLSTQQSRSELMERSMTAAPSYYNVHPLGTKAPLLIHYKLYIKILYQYLYVIIKWCIITSPNISWTWKLYRVGHRFSDRCWNPAFHRLCGKLFSTVVFLDELMESAFSTNSVEFSFHMIRGKQYSSGLLFIDEFTLRLMVLGNFCPTL